MFFCVSKGEIDAHEDSFRATDEAGQALLNTGHYASEEVKEKVVSRLYFLLCDVCREKTQMYYVNMINGVLYAAGHPFRGEGISARFVGGSQAAV